MEREQAASSRAQPLLALGALGLLVATTALAFGRVFAGGSTTLELLLVGVASTAVAVALERRSLLLATGVSVVLLIAMIGILVFPHTTLWGLPTGRTLEAVRHAIGLVRDQARVQVAPTPPFAPLVLAAIAAVWTAAFSAHALAVRAGSPLLAAAPAVALLAFADSVMKDGGRPPYAVAFLLGTLAVVFVDGVRRLRQWGPIWSRNERGRLGPPIAPARGALRMAAFAVAVAALLPGLLPGFGAGPLLAANGHPTGQVGIDPFVSVAAQLQQENQQPLFRVKERLPKGLRSTGDQPYLRTLSLDRFDGTGWTASDIFAKAGAPVASLHPAQTSLPGASPVSGPADVQHVHVIQSLTPDNGWVPVAYSPRSIDAPEPTLRYDSGLGILYSANGLEAGQTYSAVSSLPKPSRGQLMDVPAQSPVGALADYTRLPPGLSPSLRGIALSWTAGAGGPFDQLLAIQHRLLSPPFHYTLHPDLPEGPSALLEFLLHKHGGFCQQFSSAMAVLARELDIPTRIAEGYRVPPPERSGLSTVTNHEAHSWVEAYFAGYGWIAFEPTPSITNPVAQAYLAAPQPACSGKHCSDQTPGRVSGGRKGEPVAAPHHPVRRKGTGAVVKAERGLPTRILLEIALLIGATLLVVVPLGKLARRTVRLRRASDGPERVIATYELFSERAADLGLGREEGETPDEYRARLAGSVRFSNAHLERLTRATITAAYAPEGPSLAESDAARRDARVAIHDVRRSVGVARRARGLYRLGR